jgi:hypothetical protein
MLCVLEHGMQVCVCDIENTTYNKGRFQCGCFSFNSYNDSHLNRLSSDKKTHYDQVCNTPGLCMGSPEFKFWGRDHCPDP